jgi:hypothetical protein
MDEDSSKHTNYGFGSFFACRNSNLMNKIKKKANEVPRLKNLRLSQESSSSNGRRSNRSSQNYDFDSIVEESPAKTPSKYKRTMTKLTSTSIKKERRFNDISDIECDTTEKKKPKMFTFEDDSSDFSFSSEKKKKKTRFSNDFDVVEVLNIPCAH